MDMKDFQEAVEKAVNVAMKNYAEEEDDKKKKDDEDKEKSYSQFAENMKRYEEDKSKAEEDEKKKKDYKAKDNAEDEDDDDDDDDKKDDDKKDNGEKSGKNLDISTSKSFQESCKLLPDNTQLRFDGTEIIVQDGKPIVLKEEISDFMKSDLKSYQEASRKYDGKLSEYQKAFSEMNPDMKPEEIEAKAKAAIADLKK